MIDYFSCLDWFSLKCSAMEHVFSIWTRMLLPIALSSWGLLMSLFLEWGINACSDKTLTKNVGGTFAEWAIISYSSKGNLLQLHRSVDKSLKPIHFRVNISNCWNHSFAVAWRWTRSDILLLSLSLLALRSRKCKVFSLCESELLY